MTAAIMGDHTKALAEEEEHLRVPVVRRERPAMAEDDGLSCAPVLIEDLGAVLGGDHVGSVHCRAAGCHRGGHARRTAGMRGRSRSGARQNGRTADQQVAS